jgi:hypothetical protein
MIRMPFGASVVPSIWENGPVRRVASDEIDRPGDAQMADELLSAESVATAAHIY